MFNGRLLLGYPINKGHVAKCKEASPGSSDLFISSMVAVHHHSQVNVFSKQRWHVSRHCFFGISIEFGPIVLWEISFVNIRIGWVKN